LTPAGFALSRLKIEKKLSVLWNKTVTRNLIKDKRGRFARETRNINPTAKEEKENPIPPRCRQLSTPVIIPEPRPFPS